MTDAPQPAPSRITPEAVFRRRPTQMFNGYGEQVAAFYRGMDLKTYF